MQIYRAVLQNQRMLVGNHNMRLHIGQKVILQPLFLKLLRHLLPLTAVKMKHAHIHTPGNHIFYRLIGISLIQAVRIGRPVLMAHHYLAEAFHDMRKARH